MSAPAPTASSRASTPTNATAQQPPSLAAAIDQAPSSSIVAATMMRLPADQLAKLRDDFVSRPGGLTMNQFVSVMLKYSEKQATLAREATERLGRLGTPSPKSKRGKPSSLVVGTSSSPASPSPAPPPPHLISTVADLVELFHQIDVNGDDSMEWDEFTGFIINMAMASTADFHFHDHWKVRPVVEVNEKTASADRCRVPCVRWIPEIQRILVAAGPMVQVFDPYNRGVGDKLAGALGGMQLCGKIFPHDCEEDFAYKRRMMRGEDKVSCIQAIFLPSLDLVCILSSDLRINFHKAINRNGVMSESVKPAGRVPTDSQQYVMAWDDVRQQLFTAGCENEILVWKVFEVKQKVSDNNVSKYKYVATQVHLLDHHNDTIKDMITVQDPDNELDVLITASLDKSIKVFDLETLRPVRTLVGHTSGVRCLTYDFHGNLYSAGFEHDIYVWDLEAGLSYPLKKLVKGHVNPIIKIVSPYSSGRLCSLDVSGRFSWWDIRRNVALENHERCIQSFDCPPHLCQTFDLAHSVENALEFSTNGMTLVAGSKKIHAFDSVDVRPPEAPPTACVFNSVGYNFVSVHEKDLKVWDPDSGRLLQEVPNLSATEITNITFDSKGRKAIISNQGGEILIFNNSNWSKIASLPTHSSEISCLMYAKEDKCIITGSWDRSLRVYDDYHNNPSSSLLRCITNAHDSDITSIAHDFSLGLIATSSVDGNVKIWDFQFLTLDCDVTENLETESEVTVLKFVQPYPLLLSADSEGGISMIPVRPYLGTSRYKTMLRFENAGSNNYSAKVGEDGFIDPVEDANCQAIAAVAEESCAASAMEILYDPHSGPVIPPTNIPKGRHLVVTGDEHGWVRIFDISTAITKCQLQVPKDSEMPKCQNSYNPYRRCERDGNMYKAKEEKEVEEPSGDTNDAAVKNRKRRRLKRRQTTPKFASETITEDDVTLICAFPAHKEAINTLEIIQDPPSILTSSVDCSVMLWDMNGNAMGTLTRGREADSMWKRTWSFPIDKAGRRKAQLDEALSLYHSVREMEANERVQSDKHAEMVKEMAAIRARTPNSRNASPTHRRSSSKSFSSSSPKSHFPSPPKSQLDPSSPSHREEEKKEEGKGDLTPVLNGGDSMTSSGFNYSAFNEEEEDEMSEGSYFDEEEEIGHGPNALTGAQWEEEKLRLFGQLKGETTWTKTPKEVMREQVMEKRINNTKAIFKKLQAESKKDKEEDPYKFKKKKRKKKKKKKNGTEGKSNVSTSEKPLLKRKSTPAERRKQSVLPSDDDIISSLDFDKKAGNGNEMGDLFTMKTQNIVIDNDKDDPDNWAISSTNRQKSMYGCFYVEKAKMDMAARRSIIAQEQLIQSLSKPSDFILSKEKDLRRFKSRNTIMLDDLKNRRRKMEEGEGSKSIGGEEELHVLEDLLYGEVDGIVDDSPSPSPIRTSEVSDKKKKKKRSRKKITSPSSVGARGGLPVDSSPPLKISTLQHLESLATETATNQQRWRSRVENFSLKVFGDPDLERGRDYMHKKKKDRLLRGKLSPINQSIGHDPAADLKDAALRKARGGFAEHAVKGVRRKESVTDFHRRLRDATFFGPYSVKEVIMVAEVFASIGIKEGIKKEGKKHSYRDLEKMGGNHERTREAMGSKVPLHTFFEDPEMLARPHYIQSFQKLSKTSGHKNNGLVDLQTVFKTVFPYMKRVEVEEAMEFVKMEDEEIPVEYQYSGVDDDMDEMSVDPFEEDRAAQKLQQLAELFELYDVDGNGVVDVGEIKEALRENQSLYQSRKRLGSVVEQGDGDVGDMREMLKNINKEGKAEIDFDEFA
eukprot:CAMPEP_0118634084 /NCGR_PEP_ID=MMETSP0785-20121206/1349_1 /TAXON_ID=91992 /ORGANISM="Bolidomonas pacifica, Strain CCMP 1866" /LENGTH=1801 /DNA_ID=CAMNT_0006525017 /DNA_START=72 /DNA_END=5474 /DNA_ORIENTATION=+